VPAAKRPEEYQALARRRGLTWLGPEVRTATIKTTWRCPKGHEWQASYKSVMRSGCRRCLKVQPETYREVATSRGFTWLGSEVTSASASTGWRCAQGHEWLASYDSVRDGTGCPDCLRVLGPEYHALAAERGFAWLGPVAANVGVYTNWTCQQGHEWPAPYNSIQQGSGCPECAHLAQFGRSNRPKEEDDYRELARERGLTWLGPMVANIHIKTRWRCGSTHEWETCYNVIQQGSGCPYCTGTAEKQPADFHALAASRGFTWQGPIVPTTTDKTGWRCGQGHTWPAHYNSIQQGSGCPFCAGLAPKTATDYNDLAARRGFTWLGPLVANTKTKTRWQCGSNHTWEAAFHTISGGSGCPHCYKARPRRGKRRKRG
jgi:hypothetical protein